MVNLIHDINVIDYGYWPSTEFPHWLHPYHGPLPDYAARLENKTIEYIAALWDISKGACVFLEQVKEDKKDVRVPMLSLDEAHKMGGWIGHSLYWKWTSNGARRANCEISYKAYTILELYQAILCFSVELISERQYIAGDGFEPSICWV